MISMIDMVELSGLSEAEILAIAEHEHLPESAAAALGAYLLDSGSDGEARVVAMIRDDIRHALSRGDRAHAAELLAALKHFLAEHGGARGDRPGSFETQKSL
ncbi:MAG: hypothetical protein AAF899_04315 [Pseudomonadota bacterium]